MLISEELLKEKRKRFNALLWVTHMNDAKLEILESYGYTSTMQMTNAELDDVITWLSSLHYQKGEPVDPEIRKWRHKVLRLVGECGINTNDWNAVNAFLIQPRIAGCHLYEIKTVDALKTLHRKLHNVRDRKAERADLENYLATNN